MVNQKIVVVGSANTDMVLRVPRIPAPGETVLGGTFSVVQGGKGANQAVAAARAGGDVTFISKLGMDDFGARSLEGFKAAGIQCDYITRTADVSSGIALIFVADSGQNAIGVAPGANGALTVADLEAARAQITAASIVLAQLEIPLDCIHWLAAAVADSGGRFILNPAPACPLDDALLKQVSILAPNESEAALLTGIQVQDRKSAEKAARILLEKGVETIVVTMGEQGALIVNKSETIHIPSHKVQAVDTTAAGDAFCGTFAVALAEGCSLEDSARFASAAAALSVTKMGAQPSMHSRKEIEALLNRT